MASGGEVEAKPLWRKRLPFLCSPKEEENLNSLHERKRLPFVVGGAGHVPPLSYLNPRNNHTETVFI